MEQKRFTQPTNNKALYHEVGGTVAKLHNDFVENGRTTTKDDLEAIKVMGIFTQQMINLKAQDYLKAKTEMDIIRCNKEFGSNIVLQNVEGKAFD